MTHDVTRRALIGAGAAMSATALGAGPLASPAKAGRGHGPGHGAGTRTIIHNARVFVGDSRGTIADAIAVGRNGRIVAVGRGKDLRRLKGRQTEVIDARGGTVIAGIHDGHVHPTYAGLGSLNPSLEDAVLTAAEVTSLVETFLADPTYGTEPDSWLVVEAWNPAGTPSDGVAHRSILDAISTARPIALNGSDGHNLWANSRALDLAGIDDGTPDPTGGEIVRDGTGRATGVLKDTAQDLVRSFIPEPAPEVMYGAIAGAFAHMAASGITTAHDAWVEEWALDFYRALAESGELPQRMMLSLLAPADQIGRPRELLAEHRRMARAFGDVPGLRFGVKVFMDGVIEYPAQTAALLSPYLDEEGNPTDHYGELYVDGPTMGKFATVYDKAGWQVHAHAIGDAAVRAALDGFEVARHANKRRGTRHAIAHLQLVDPSDYGRFRPLDVVPCLQLQWATVNVWTMEALKPYIGEERHARLYPAKSILRAGGALSGGSDWPVDPLYPWNQVQSAIDRYGIYGEGEPLGIDQAISRTQSLLMHTRGTARQLAQLDRTGTLEVGKQADLVMLDQDITTCPVSEIHASVPQLTLVGGRTVFDLSTSTGRAVRRSMERSAAAGAVLGASRVSHAGLASRHAGCPCAR